MAVLSVAAVACSESSAASPGANGSNEPTPAKTSPTEAPMVQVLAPIHEVSVNIAESLPPQYFVAVTSGLPNGCIQFDRYELSRNGEEITISVTNLEPATSAQPIACTDLYGLVDTTIPLGSDFEGGKTYTVLVNDVTETFVAQGTPGPLPTGPAGPAMVKVAAPIEGVEVNVAESFPPQYFVMVTSGLPNGCFQFDNYELSREGEEITITVTNLVPADQSTPCTEQLRTVESNVALGSDFEGGKTYTVLVNDVTETFVAQGGDDAEPRGGDDAEPRGGGDAEPRGGALDDVFVDLGQPVSLGINKAAVFGPDEIRIQFLLVMEDTRCPEGDECEQPGTAMIMIGLSGGLLPPTPLQLALETPFAYQPGLEIEVLALEPYPGPEPRGRADSAYVATIQVSGPGARGE